MEKMDQAIWIAHSLFDRGHVTGSTANLSFEENGTIYVTSSGSCFGTLSEADFSALSPEGELLAGRKPSKEYPLHLMMYRHCPGTGAVIHTHSQYATLWSCLPGDGQGAAWPAYTPYLQMRLGALGRIPYAKPGTKALFDLAERSLCGARGYLLENHGPIVTAASLMDAFCDLEELEESARTAWLLRGTAARTI